MYSLSQNLLADKIQFLIIEAWLAKNLTRGTTLMLMLQQITADEVKKMDPDQDWT